jgi:flagellar hook protein FlgE
VQGWTAKDGVVNAAGKPDDIRMPLGSTIPPKQTSSVTLKGNLSSDITPDPNNPANTGFGPDGGTPVTGYETTIPIKVYDSQGATHTITAKFHRTGLDDTVTPKTSDWAVDFTDEQGNAIGTQTLNFQDGLPWDMSGGAPGVQMKSMPVGTDPSDSTKPLYTVDVADITSYSGLSDARVFDTDGQAPGALTSVSYSVSDSGQIIGVYSNGLKETLGQVAMATFKNVNGLEKVGDSEFRSTVNSGYAQVGTPGSAGMGSVVSGALEMSNVDLAAEFTNLIVAQRGFEANSKVITTSDEILQDLVSMKR